MRITLSTILLLFIFSAALTAQVTITAASAPVPGETWNEYYPDDLPDNFTLGSPGPDQTWDYSDLNATFEPELLQFWAPADLPGDFATAFPNSDLAIFFPGSGGDEGGQYLRTSNDGLYVDGIRFVEGGDLLEQDFEPDNLLVPFGFTYLDEVSDFGYNEAYVEEYGATIWVKSYTMQEMEGDGYGDIMLPNGSSYSDVLRCKILKYTIDSIFVDEYSTGDFEFISTDGPTDSSLTYFHLQQDSPLLVCSVVMDANSNELWDFNYNKTAPLSLAESSSYDRVSVYPNPSDGIIWIDSNELESLRILDLSGRTILFESARNLSDRVKIDLSHLQQGTYILQAESRGAIFSQKIFKE